MAEDTLSPAPLLRKNGKPQSCEPCRKSKLACDHAHPCARCVRLRRVSLCIYDPSPTATDRGNKKRKLSPTVENGGLTSLVRFDLLDHNQEGFRNGLTALTPQEPKALDLRQTSSLRKSPSLTNGLQRRQSVRFRPGYMGKTSYSAILNEYEPSLGHNPDAVSPPTVRQEVDPQHLQLAMEILSCLPSVDVSRRALYMYCSGTVSVSLHLPTMKLFHEDFWSAYGDYLTKPRSSKRVQEAARLLTQRVVESPFNSVFDSNTAYLAALTHRWEMLGVLFTVFAALGVLVPATHELTQQMLPVGVKPQHLSSCMLECAEACLRLVDLLDTGLNVWVAFLSYRCSALRGFLAHSGDTNYTYWRRNVQLCGDMTALGLHRLQSCGQSGSLLHVEQQKRTFIVAFAHDKHMSVFLGRPPSLSKRYVTTQPLLDASDESLFKDDIYTIRSTLNEYGYNNAGNLYRATIVRVFYYLSIIYEDILEISLGASAVDYDRVRAVKASLDEHIRQQPAKLHRTINRELFQNYPLLEAFAAVEVQLVNLHQRLLLDRIERGTEALNFGQVEEMLRIVLTFWTEREQYPGHEDDNHWTICCYGIPAASAIAVGLWKAPQDSSWTRSRSETIQNLSLFIACLDWVKPADGNYELCQRTMHMLREILDRILAPPAVESFALSAEDLGSWDMSNFSIAGMPNFGINVDDLFSSEWMNAPRANFS